MSEPGTLVGCLERAASRSGLGVRFVARSERNPDRHFTYSELAERALDLAGGLRALGLRPGERVAIVRPTGPGFYQAFFGALLAGAVPVPLPLPRRFGAREDYVASTRAMLRASGARLALTSERTWSGVSEAASELELGARTEVSPRRCPPADVRPEDLALVQFTSGTTSAPKPVGLTHAQLLTNVRAMLAAFVAAHPECEGFEHSGVSWLPLYHDMGLVGSVLTAVVHPGPLTLLEPELFVSRPARWLRTISKYGATVSAAPHFAYALAVERVRDGELDGVDLSSWRLALDGAETVTPKILERFLERFAGYGLREEALTPVYGLAEAGLAVTFSDPLRRFRVVDAGAGHGRELVSAGKPLAGFEVRIREGRVLVRGPSVVSQYLGQPPMLDEDGFLDTGDEGFLEDGELYLTGRDRDKIVLRGTNYTPEVFEAPLEHLPGIRPGSVAACGAVADDGDELVILAETAPGGIEVKAIEALLAERTGVVPNRVVLLEPGALPRTSSGKIRRGEAAKRFLS